MVILVIVILTTTRIPISMNRGECSNNAIYLSLHNNRMVPLLTIGGEWRLSSNRSLPWSEELLERYKDKWNWKILTRIESLPWSESLIERYADKWVWAGASEKTRKRMLDDNEAAIKLFNSWTKQEISTALDRIGSVHKDLPHVYDSDNKNLTQVIPIATI